MPTATAQQADSGDRDALVALYNATGGANWTNNSNWLSDEPIREWHEVYLDSLGRVTSLSLGGNQATRPRPPGLGRLSNLQGLDLSTNQLSGEIPAELGRLSNLEGLDLIANRLSGEIPSPIPETTTT